MVEARARIISEAEVALRDQEGTFTRWVGEARRELREEVEQHESPERAHSLYQEQSQVASDAL